MTAFVISMPPSANRLWRVTGRKGNPVVRSPEYLGWLTTAGWEIRAQCVPMTAGPVSVLIEVERIDKRRRDIDNRCKPVLDCCVHGGAIEDDSLVQSVTIRWADVKGVRVTIDPWTIGMQHIAEPLARVMDGLAAKVGR